MARAHRLLFVWWIAVGLVPASARAQAAPEAAFSLEVEGPAWLPPCLSQAKLQASIESRAAAPLPERLAVRVRADAAEGAQPTRFTIEVADARGELGTRSIEVQPADCAALPDAVAIVVLLLAQATEPSAGGVEPAPQPATTGPAPAPPAAPPPAVVPPPATLRLSAPADRTRRVALSPGMELMFELLPEPGVAVFVEGALGLGELTAVALRVRYLVPQSREIAEGSVQFAVYELTADFCVGSLDYESMPIGLRLCLGPSAAMTVASGTRFTLQNRNEIDGMASLEGRAGASVALAPWTWIRLEAGARLAALRPRFFVRVADGMGERPVHAPGLVQTTVGLGLVQLF